MEVQGVSQFKNGVAEFKHSTAIPSLCAHFDVDHPSINTELLYSKCDQGQAYRSSLVSGRWMAMVACGMELVKSAQYVHIAQNLGVKIFLVEDPKCLLAQQLEADGHVIHVKVNMESRPSLVQDVVKAIKEAVTSHYLEVNILPKQLGNSSPGLLAGVFTLWDDAVCLASRVQKELGCKGDIPSVIDRCHDKFNSRIALEKAGIKGPKSILLKNQTDCEANAHLLRYPVILKPINGAASIGVHKFESAEELIAKFPKCQQEMEDIYAHEELMGLAFADSTSDVTSLTDLKNFCAEEFIGGVEYDVDIILSYGKHIYGGINQDWCFKEGWMCERGMHHPCSLNKEKYAELVAAAGKNAMALGCTTGVFHVEMKWDPDLGPQLIECNPRMGGAAVWQLHRNSWSVDLLLETAMCFIGIPSNPVIPEESHGTNISLLLYCQKSGVLREDLDDYNQHLKDTLPFLDFLLVPMKAGQQIHGWDGSIYPSHIGRIDFFIPKDKMTHEEAIQWGLKQRSHIVVPLESGDWSDPNDDKVY